MATAVGNHPSHGTRFSTDYTTAGVTVSLSTTTAKSAALVAGTLYRVVCPSAWHFRQGPQATVTATTTDYLIPAAKEILVWVSEAAVDDGIAGILDASTATLYIQACR